MKYDVIVVGSGPGGYVTAIRASQLGFKTAVVERESVGGVCLNWGCIPTKALLKSAQVYKYVSHSIDYGVKIEGEVKPHFEGIIDRSREVANGMNKGVKYLFKKNKIDLLEGHGTLKEGPKVEVEDKEGNKNEYEAKHVIIATGARSRQLEGMKQDGKKIIGYREAMTLKEQPESMVVVGSGAIGSEFAHFYNTLGTKVTLVEYLPNILPVEDEEASRQLARSFKKNKMKVMTGAKVTEVDTSGDKCKVKVETKKGEEEIEADLVLSAVGIKSNIENLGLEELGIKTEKDKITVDEFYRTNIEGFYAIGDVIPGPALAHVASHEGIICVEKIAGEDPEPLDYNNIPSCTYTVPEVASVGYTEKQAKEKGYDIKVGKFPFSASGKAKASGAPDGFVKVIFDAKYGEWLGAHMVGENVTEIISEAVVARKLETTAHEIIKAVHPHPTLSEAVMEAVAAAYDEVIHI